MPPTFDEPIICPTQIGRDDQLDALQRVAAGVGRGPGQTVLIAGEAGIGKSRLVRELGDRLGRDGWLVQHGSCFERDRVLPYAPFLDALHVSLTTLSPAEVQRCFGPAVPDLARLLPELGHPSVEAASDPEQEKRRIFRTVCGVFSCLADTRPLLLVIEDLHWADDTSLDLIAVLAMRIRSERILLLGTYRDDEVNPALGYLLDDLDRNRLSIELRLRRLGRDEVGAMLNAIRKPDQPVGAEFVRAIYDLSEGNPFFVEELLRSSTTGIDVDMPVGASDRGRPNEFRLPRTAQDAVQRRVERVSTNARQVLVLAAVAGRRFDFELLERVSGRDEAELLELLKELIKAQLVVEVENGRDQFAFRHALTREAVYEQLLGRERRREHRRVGEAIEQFFANAPEPRLEDLAYHFSEAGDWAKALVYSERAGERADTLGAPASAVEHYARAIEAVRQQARPVPSRLHRARGMAYERLGDFERARASHEAALTAGRVTGDRRAEWQALLDLGFLWAGRTYEHTRAYFADGLDLARRLDDPRALAHSLNRVGNWHVNVEQPADGERHHREALALYEQLDDDHGIAETLDLLGLAEYMQGNLDRAVSYLDRAITLFRRLDDRAGLTSALAHRAVSVTTYHACTAPTLPRHAREAPRMVGESIRIAEELGWRASEAFGHMVLASVLGPIGEYTRALAEAQAALQIAEEIDHRQWICASRYVLGEIHRDVLAVDAAREQFESALALARELGSGNWITVTTGALASTLLAAGATRSATSLLEEFAADDKWPATMGRRQVRLAVAELALQQSDATGALQLLDTLRGNSATAPAVDLVRARAMRTLGRLDEAQATLVIANSQAMSCSLASMSWRLYAEQALVLDSLGRRADAELARSDGVAVVQSLAGNLSGTDLGEGFLAGAHRALGIEPPSRRRVRRGPGGLTVREQDIARLLAEGKSNRAMADRLVLSERTVEDHVSRILKKLDFTSRAQIAAWATQQGHWTGESE